MSTNRIFGIILVIILLPVLIGLNRVHKHAAARQEATERESAKRLADYKKKIENDRKLAEEARTERIKEINQAGAERDAEQAKLMADAEKDPSRVYGEDPNKKPLQKVGKKARALKPDINNLRPTAPLSPPSRTANASATPPEVKPDNSRHTTYRYQMPVRGYSGPIKDGCPYDHKKQESYFLYYCAFTDVYVTTPLGTVVGPSRMTPSEAERAKARAHLLEESVRDHSLAGKEYQSSRELQERLSCEAMASQGIPCPRTPLDTSWQFPGTPRH